MHRRQLSAAAAAAAAAVVAAAAAAAAVVAAVVAAAAAEAEQTGRVQPRCSEICLALAENNIRYEYKIFCQMSNASLSQVMKGLKTKTTTTTAAEINDDTTNMQATVSQSQTLVFWF